MIGKVAKRGNDPAGLLDYLFGPGRRNEHVNQRLIAAWCGDTAHLEPPTGDDGKPDVTRLAAMLMAPAALTRSKIPKKSVWHCVVRAAKSDRELSDAEFRAIAEEVMHRTGLSERGQEDRGVRWVAVHHGDNHIHIVAYLARMDGRPVRLHGDWYQVGKAMTWAEHAYGLTVVPRGKGTNRAKEPTRAEVEKAARTGRSQAARTELKRLVEEAAGFAVTEEAFFRELATRGVQVKLRYSKINPGEITGYAVGLQGDVNAEGKPVMFSGGKLARNLTLPRLRARWRPETSPGYRMNSATAKAVLRREITAAASAACTEETFFLELAARGIDVHLHHDPARPGRVLRYSAGLPGRVNRAGAPIRYAAGTLNSALTLGRLRAHWRRGHPGAADPGLYDGVDRDTIYAHAAGIANWAAQEIRRDPRCRADVALATADVVNAAADATGSRELRAAAQRFMQISQTAKFRTPARTPTGQALRVSARLIRATRPPHGRTGSVLLDLVAAVIILIAAVTEFRNSRNQQKSAIAARRTAAGIRTSLPPSAHR